MKIKLMKQLCKMKQETLKRTLYRYLKNNYSNVTKTNSYIIAEGNIPICLVAHMDTVFKTCPEEIYYDENKKVMWSPQGLGADDRAGIYAIVKIIEDGYRPSIIFTADEEKGGLGARALVKDYPECPFLNLKAIIELDRQGKNDCVFYECDNEDFTAYIKSFGFEPEWGSFSDISFIAPDWGVAAVNLSVGYFDEHSYVERLFCEYLDDTIQKVKKILDKAETMENYAYVPLTPIYTNRCAICQHPLNIANMNLIKVQDAYFYICDDCKNAYYKNE